MFTDEQRLRFLMSEADIDSFFRVKKDRYEYAQDVALDNGSREVSYEDELEGFRRMVDDAMVAYNFGNKNI